MADSHDMSERWPAWESVTDSKRSPFGQQSSFRERRSKSLSKTEKNIELIIFVWRSYFHPKDLWSFSRVS